LSWIGWIWLSRSDLSNPCAHLKHIIIVNLKNDQEIDSKLSKTSTNCNHQTISKICTRLAIKTTPKTEDR
jgi:hypothetical protein